MGKVNAQMAKMMDPRMLKQMGASVERAAWYGCC